MSTRARFLPLAAAIEECVRDGDHVAMEGFTHLIPFAAGHEVIRQGRKRLTLYRMTPDLIYDQLIGMGAAERMVESGTIGTRLDVLPLSIGDGELCDTALTTVGVSEMFRYWLQGGRITVGFLGGAQIDRFANLNTTVVGAYARPKVRLPGGGGAPEIATQCQQIFVTMAQNPRAFVAKLDFITSFGHGEGGDHRRRMGIRTRGPTRLITDLAVLEPEPETREMVVTWMYPKVTRKQLTAATGWPLRFAAEVHETAPPTRKELSVLRDLHERTHRAHAA